MPTRNSADQIITSIELALNGNLSEEERDEITVWQKGRALAQVSGFYGFEVICEMLRDKAEDAAHKAVTTDPGDRDEVLANQAVAFAAQRLYASFIEDVNAAIEASRSTPSAMKRKDIHTQIPMESM